MVWELWSCPRRQKRFSLRLQSPHPHQAVRQHRRVRGQSLKCLCSVPWFWTPPAILVGAPNFKMTSSVYFCCHRLELGEIAGVCLWTLSPMVKINSCRTRPATLLPGVSCETVERNEHYLWYIYYIRKKSNLLILLDKKRKTFVYEAMRPYESSNKNQSSFIIYSCHFKPVRLYFVSAKHKRCLEECCDFHCKNTKTTETFLKIPSFDDHERHEDL